MFNLTKFHLSLVLGFLCVIVMAMPSASAMSLWNDPGAGLSMYSDRKAHAVGDTLTIIISENSSANRAGSATNSKTTTTEINAGVGIFSVLSNASAGNSDKFAANGSIVNTNSVNARMTAQVLEVKPNGNLIISGMQSIKQNGEEQKITISGIVRTEDITTDNTVRSSAIGDAVIKVEGKGPITRKQRQGILSQIFNFLF
ncbi:MAG: flagellar basal body L-ring protein FlgH [Sporomusaceae bacterium]|nr:flagellar basal body L-ring protein FlgH [Sporomusaceae bacterium]